MEMQSEFDRLLFFEHARKTAETNYAQNPLDADVRISSFSLHIIFVYGYSWFPVCLMFFFV